MWIQAPIGLVLAAASVFVIYFLLSIRESFLLTIYGVALASFGVAIGVLMALPIILALTDLFGLTNNALRNMLHSVGTAQKAAQDSELALNLWLIGGYATLCAIAAPFLALPMLRENHHSIQGWLLLLAIPFGYLVALPVFGPTLGVALPDNPVVDWVTKSIAEPIGIVALAVIVEINWFINTFVRRWGINIGPVAFTLQVLGLACAHLITFGDMPFLIKVLLWVVVGPVLAKMFTLASKAGI